MVKFFHKGTILLKNSKITRSFYLNFLSHPQTSDWSTPSFITTSSCPPDPPQPPLVTSSSSSSPLLSHPPPPATISPSTTISSTSQHISMSSDSFVEPLIHPPLHPSPTHSSSPAPHICHPLITWTHEISWQAPPDNGSAIIEYVVEYKEEEEGMGGQEFQKVECLPDILYMLIFLFMSSWLGGVVTEESNN